MAVPEGATREWLDAQYDARALVSDPDAIFARWREDSGRLRAELGPDRRVGIPYGGDPRQHVVLHLPVRTPSAVVVFVHGGYWQALDAATFDFLAAPFLERGVAFANVEYRLVPQVAMDDVVADVRAGVAELARRGPDLGVDTRRLAVTGHSAGGHLVAMLMAEDWSRHGLTDVVGAGCAISGLYDLDPIRRTYLNDVLGLSPEDAERNSPVHRTPTSRGPLLLTCGGDEPGEFDRQQRELAAAWDTVDVSILEQPDGHHFVAVERLAAPGPLHDAVLEMLS